MKQHAIESVTKSLIMSTENATTAPPAGESDSLMPAAAQGEAPAEEVNTNRIFIYILISICCHYAV